MDIMPEAFTVLLISTGAPQAIVFSLLVWKSAVGEISMVSKRKGHGRRR